MTKDELHITIQTVNDLEMTSIRESSSYIGSFSSVHDAFRYPCPSAISPFFYQPSSVAPPP